MEKPIEINAPVTRFYLVTFPVGSYDTRFIREPAVLTLDEYEAALLSGSIDNKVTVWTVFARSKAEVTSTVIEKYATRSKVLKACLIYPEVDVDAVQKDIRSKGK